MHQSFLYDWQKKNLLQKNKNRFKWKNLNQVQMYISELPSLSKYTVNNHDILLKKWHLRNRHHNKRWTSKCHHIKKKQFENTHVKRGHCKNTQKNILIIKNSIIGWWRFLRHVNHDRYRKFLSKIHVDLNTLITLTRAPYIPHKVFI